jgi:transposase InsO family protein
VDRSKAYYFYYSGQGGGVYQKIMYRFGVSNNIIIDNMTQFTTREFKDFCADSGIKINHASVSHLQSNGQVERSNGMILQGLKPRIFDRLKPYAGKWVKELSSVLWALHTTPSQATGHTQRALSLARFEANPSIRRDSLPNQLRRM